MPRRIAAVFTLNAALIVAQVTAKPTFPSLLPNGANVVGVETLGHVDTSGGGELNAFGTDFGSAGFAWTTKLCEADSDEDGQTNGQELGDPCCKWAAKSSEKVQWITGVSHPGDAASTSDPTLWANVICGSETSESASSTTTTTPTPTPTPSNSTTTPTTKAPSSFTTVTKAPSTSTTTAPNNSTNTTASSKNTTTISGAATATTPLAVVATAVALTALIAIFA